MSEVSVNVTLTPEQLAEQFWNAGSDGQADFFAALERLAGYRLCLQMAWVVHEIEKRSRNGDRDAQQGFQTMLAHAQGYVEGATEIRTWQAQRDIARMVAEAKP